MSRLNLTRLVGVVATFTATLLVAGCSTAAAPTPPAVTSSEAPAATETVEATPAPTPETLVDRYPDDATIPVEFVTDQYGTYAAVALDPDSELAQFNINQVEGDWASIGFNENDLQDAHDLALSFAIEQVVDAPAFDNRDAFQSEQWVDEALGTLISAEKYSEDSADFLVDNGFIELGLMPENLVRDGQQRTSITGEVTRMYVTVTEDNRSMIEVEFSLTAEAPTTAEQIEGFLRPRLEGDGLNYEDTIEQYDLSFLLDGKDNEGMRVGYTATYRYILSDLREGLLSGHEYQAEVTPYQR